MENLYRMNTAVAVNNSGSGDNVLTKPAGIETASILMHKKYSVYIPSAAIFTTDFNSDGTNYSVGLYAKPNVGAVLEVDGNTISYTGHSYAVENETGESASIPVRSNRVRFIAFVHSDFEAGMYIDGKFVSVHASTNRDLGSLDISVLPAGGLVDNIFATKSVLSNSDIEAMLEDHLDIPQEHISTVAIEDDNRDFVQIRRVLDEISLDPETMELIQLDANECLSFKIEYELDGDADIAVNGYPAYSGFSLAEEPDEILVISGGCTLRNLDITEYYSNELMGVSDVDFEAKVATGTPAPVHLHDDNAGAGGVDAIMSLVSGEVFKQDTPPQAGTTYRWTGAPHVSASEKVVDGQVVETNLARYPRGTALFGNNHGTSHTTDRGVQVPAPHPDGITTCVTSVPVDPDNRLLASWYDIGESERTVNRGVRVCVYVKIEGATATTYLAGNPSNNRTVSLVAGEWTPVTTPVGSGASALTVTAPAGTTAGQVWATGTTALGNEVPSYYFDGDSPDDRARDLWIDASDGNTPYIWDSVADAWVALDQNMTFSGWFKAQDGPVFPGIEMQGNVLSGMGTDFYVNGKVYNGEEVVGWYFLSVQRNLAEGFSLDLPVHSINISDPPLTANEIGDLYETFFGNAILDAPPVTVSLSEQPAFIISTEWSIVSSG